MASSYTSLLGLVLPVTGELSGTWGQTINDSLTSLLDTAIAGTTTLNTDADVTLTTSTGAANQARQAIILWTANGTVTRNITAPAQSKIYTVINASAGTQSIVIRGAGPTTGVTIVKGESAVVAWNGSDFIKISNTGGAGSFTNVTVSGTTTLSGLTASTALALDASKNVVSVTNTGTGNNVLATSPTLTTPTLGAATATSINKVAITAPATGSTLTIADGKTLTANNSLTLAGTDATTMTFPATSATIARTDAAQTFTGTQTFSSNPVINGGTANGVAYLDGSKVLTTGSALVFDSSNRLGIQVTPMSTGANGDDLQIGNPTISVGAGLTIGATTTGDIQFSDATSGTGQYAGLLRYSHSNDSMQFWVASSEQMRLTSTGLGIGTSSPGQRLEIQAPAGASQNATIRLRATDSGGNSGSVADIAAIGTGGQVSALAFSTRDGSSILERLRLDGAGNLGIGTTSPGTFAGTVKTVIGGGSGNPVLTLYGGSATYSGIYFADGTSGNQQYRGFFEYNHANDSLLIGTSGAAKATLDSSGNLGLGVTPSAWGFAGNLQTVDGGVFSSRGENFHLAANTYFNAGWKYAISSAAASRYTQATGAHQWFTAPSGTAGNSISFTQAMTLDSSGNLGVGTSSIAAAGTTVHVNGASTDASLRLSNSSTGSTTSDGFKVQLNTLDTYLVNYEAGFMAFWTNATERARITSGGITLFGKTNDYSLGTQPGFVIASATLAVASDNTASANNRNWSIITNGYENGSFDFASSSANNTWANDAYRMSVTRGGSTYNTTGTYGTLTSDERLKQDIVDAASQWDDIKAIRFRKFRMKAEVAADGDAAGVRLGVIAQEVAVTSPNLVTRRIANDKDISVVPELEGKEVLGFKDSVLFWKAAKALQEAMARIEALEVKVAALESK